MRLPNHIVNCRTAITKQLLIKLNKKERIRKKLKILGGAKLVLKGVKPLEHPYFSRP